jgi:hypothetical protein
MDTRYQIPDRARCQIVPGTRSARSCQVPDHAPGGGFILSGRLPRGVKSHRSPKTGRWGELFTLLDFRVENQILVITISTISMHQNCSISCLAAPGGAQAFSAHLDPPRYNYDVQSTWHDLVPGTIWYLVPGIHIYIYPYISIYMHIYTYPYIHMYITTVFF